MVNSTSSSLSGILRNPAYVKANEDILDYLEVLVWKLEKPDGQCEYSHFYAKNTSNLIAAIAKHHGVIEPDVWLEVQSILNENKDKILEYQLKKLLFIWPFKMR